VVPPHVGVGTAVAAVELLGSPRVVGRGVLVELHVVVGHADRLHRVNHGQTAGEGHVRRHRLQEPVDVGDGLGRQQVLGGDYMKSVMVLVI
jgi:hypothetical protein